ncbi:Chromatin assembly factor 1, subunit A, partial [Rhizopus stolonifer]
DTRQKQAENEQELEEKRKKKEEERKRKEDEKRKREEEKRLREEERKRQKEEERRLRDEEKKKREEEKRKKEQSQLRLTSLFTKTSISDTPPHIEKIIEPAKPTLFPAFYIKDNVDIAQTHQFTNPVSSYEDFRSSIHSSFESPNINRFLSEIVPESKQKRGVSTPVDIRTLLLPGSADLLNVPNVRLVLRLKLLQFMEDVRPAYYGTFTKRSRVVNGRNPFAQDKGILNYEVDSEAEWEPEGEGEDIHSDEDDDDSNTDMIDPEDAGWLVPEGYLSDNEGVDDEHGGTERAHPVKNSSKRVTIRKVVLGPFFEGESEENEAFRPFETQFFMDIPEGGYNPFYKELTTKATSASSNAINTSSVQHKMEFTTEQSKALIHVIHEKSKESITNIITEAKTNLVLKDVSKRQLEAKIKDVAVKEKRGSDTVSDVVRRNK